eukprot:jgi/Ulvmu1/10277/UM060_0079.1
MKAWSCQERAVSGIAGSTVNGLGGSCALVKTRRGSTRHASLYGTVGTRDEQPYWGGYVGNCTCKLETKQSAVLIEYTSFMYTVDRSEHPPFELFVEILF